MATCAIQSEDWCTGKSSQDDTGGTDQEIPIDVSALPGEVSQLAVGANHGCILVDGDVYCWGRNGRGQLGTGDFTDVPIPTLVLRGAIAVTAGGEHTCALRTSGGVACWGDDRHGQLGDGGPAVTGEDGSTVPVDFAGATGVLQIQAGHSSTCLRTSAGWRCAGYRGHGQLGDGTTLLPTYPWAPMTL